MTKPLESRINSSRATTNRRLPEILLAGIGIFVFIAGFITNNGSAASALIILAGICIVSFSVMFYFFSPSRELKSEVYDAASISNALVVGNLLSAMNLKGNGVYVPASRVGRTMVFLPQSEEGFDPDMTPKVEEKFGMTIVQVPGAKGVYMVPAGEGLMDYAKSIGATFYPEGLEKDLRDILVNGTELAARASIQREGDDVHITLKNIAYKGMCEAIRKNNPSICQWAGCPVCSFTGCMVAESTDKSARIDDVYVDGDTINLTYKLF